MPFDLTIDAIEIPAKLFRVDPHADDDGATVEFRAAEVRDAERWEEQWLPQIQGQPEASWPWRVHIEAAATQPRRLCVALTSGGALDALISLVHGDQTSRLTPEADVVYIEYVSISPSHYLKKRADRKVTGLGEYLIQTAVRLSLDLGFDGRVGLHAKGAKNERYYLGLGFTPVQYEETEDGTWLYFESSPGKVAAILSRGGT